jgi:uncharacterized protein DUF5753/helix-turn-helix protein
MGDKATTVRMRELGLALRRAVRATGMNNNTLAFKLGWSGSKVSNMFSGRRGASEVDVAAVLALCGIRGPARDNLLKLARDSQEPGWWQDYDDRLPVEQTTLIDYEDAAIAITNFATDTVPGLLQAPEHIRAILHASVTTPAEEIEERVAARLRRQDIFNRRYPPRFRFFIDEYALRRTGPGRETMSEQVHHLLRMSVRPYVEIRVIPDSVGYHGGMKSFHLMEFTELHPVVMLEDQTSALFLERRPTTTAYRRIANTLASVALTEGQSREWIASLATELGAPREEQDDDARLAEEHLHP